MKQKQLLEELLKIVSGFAALAWRGVWESLAAVAAQEGAAEADLGRGVHEAARGPSQEQSHQHPQRHLRPKELRPLYLSHGRCSPHGKHACPQICW